MTAINYIYLLQEREFLKTNENIYKIGKTKQENLKRLCNYPNGTQLIFQMICDDCDIIEKQLLDTFKDKYLLQKDIGNEYFKGNYKDMIDDIYNHIKIEENLPNINVLYNNIKGNFKELDLNILWSKNIFITINPNAQITLLDFINKINKMMSKKWITNYLYVYEQRGETEAELGKGFHFHCILEKPKTKAYSHMIAELSNSANSVCDTSNFHFFNIKSISEEEKKIKIAYITATKADPAKYLKQQMDVIWREKNNLKKYYNVGII